MKEIITKIKQIAPMESGWSFSYLFQNAKFENFKFIKNEELSVQTVPIIGQAVIERTYSDNEVEDSIDFVVLNEDHPQTLYEFQRDLLESEQTYPLGVLEPGRVITMEEIGEQEMTMFENHQRKLEEEHRIARGRLS